MDEEWHDILSASSSEDNDVTGSKEALADELLKMHIHTYNNEDVKGLKWVHNDHEMNILTRCILMVTYGLLLQKLKTTNVFKECRTYLT